MITAQEIREARACVKRDLSSHSNLTNNTARKAPRFTDEQRAWLKDHAHEYIAREAAELLGCATNTVRAQAKKLGITLKAGVPYNHDQRQK